MLGLKLLRQLRDQLRSQRVGAFNYDCVSPGNSRGGDNRLMAEMNAIEDADGEKEWTGKLTQFRNRSQDLHSLGPAHPRHFRQRQNSRKNVDRFHCLQFFHRDRAFNTKPSRFHPT